MLAGSFTGTSVQTKNLFRGTWSRFAQKDELEAFIIYRSYTINELGKIPILLLANCTELYIVYRVYCGKFDIDIVSDANTRLWRERCDNGL